MYHSHSIAKSDEAVKKQLESARATVLLLAKVSSAIKSRRFKSWFESTESYLPWVSSVIFKRLQKDLMFQVTQCPGISNKASDFDNLTALAFKMEEAATGIENMFNLEIKKSDKRFVVPQSSCLSNELHSLLPETGLSGLFKENHFYLFNALDSVFVYVLSRLTLEKPTGNAFFDKQLLGLTESYLLDGYPHDLLAHDALSFAGDRKIKYWLFKNEYCATQLVFEGEAIPVTSGYKCVPVKSLQSKAA